MPIDVSQTVKTIKNKITSAPIIKKVLSNALFTSVLIIVSMMLILLFTLRNSELDDKYKILLRGGVYGFIVCAGIVFLNNHKITSEIKIDGRHEGIGAVFRSVTNSENNDLVSQQAAQQSSTTSTDSVQTQQNTPVYTNEVIRPNFLN